MPVRKGRTRTKQATRAAREKLPPSPPLLNLEVIHGDITEVAEGDVYVAGHYIDVTPQFAEEALDEIVSDESLRWAPGDETRPNVVQLKRSRRVIHALTLRRAIKGSLGEVYLFPVAGWHAETLDERATRRVPRMIAIAGMGHMGAFGPSELRRLGQAVAGTVARLPGRDRICSVLIGSGFGNLQVEQAVFELVTGVADGIRETTPDRVMTLAIVERNIGRAHLIYRVARQRFNGDSNVAVRGRAPVVHRGARISTDDAYVLSIGSLVALANQGKGGVKVLTEALKPAIASIDKSINSGDAIRTALAGLAALDNDVFDILVNLEVRLRKPTALSAAPTRLTCVREMDDKGAGILSLAALSSSAVVPKRFNPVDWSLVLDLVNQVETLGETQAAEDEITKFPGLLRQILIPRDFRDYVSTTNGAGPQSSPLVLELDRQTAMIHWELLETSDTDHDCIPVATVRPVSRQLRTEYSSAPGARAPNGNRLGVLLIASPGDPDDESYLRQALAEVEAIAALLEDLGESVAIDILASSPEDEHRSGRLAAVPAASRLEVLQRLLSSRQYDIVHFSGHAFFDEGDPTRSGWEFPDGVLTANELSGMETVPQLVIANACQSAKTAQAKTRRSDRVTVRDNALAPSLADEFFKRGVRAYVGTTWSIADDGAVEFARQFYEALLLEDGSRTVRRDFSAAVGEAMLAARRHLWKRKGEHGLAWAAYQHYGDPTMQIVVPGSRQ